MRKFAATACLALLLLGCERSLQNEAILRGLYHQPVGGGIVRGQTRTSGARPPSSSASWVSPKPTQIVPALAQAVADPDPGVRLAALKSLEKLAPKARGIKGSSAGP